MLDATRRCERRCPPRWRCPPGRTRPLARPCAERCRSRPTRRRRRRARLVLALQARVRLDQLDPAETLDELFQGVSSRRNQVLIDLGREFGLSGAEGVQRQPIGELVEDAARAGRGVPLPGRRTCARRSPPGLARAGVAARRRGSGLAAGPDRARARALALDTRPGRRRAAASSRACAAGAGPARPRRRADRRRPRDRARRGPRRAGRAAPRRRDPRLEDALLDSARALADGLGQPFAGRRAARRARPRRERLAILDAELGAERARRDRPALRPPPPRALRVGLGERALGPRHRLPRRARRPDRDVRGARPRELDRLATPRPAIGRAARRRRAAALARARPAAPRRSGRRPWAALPAACRAAGRHARRARARPRSRTDDASRAAVDRPALVAALARRYGLARPARRDRARHRRDARLDRRRARAAAAARRRDRRRRDLDRHARAAALLPRAVPHSAGPGRRAARRAREPRVVRRHRRAARAGSRSPAAGGAGATTCGSTRSRRRSSRRSPRCRTAGDAGEAGAGFEIALRLQLLGVQRLVGALAARAPVAVLLPLSPNHGALRRRRPVRRDEGRARGAAPRARAREPWGATTRIVAPRIGWVRGTGLMGANDAVAPLVEERLGVRTFSRRRDGLAADRAARHARDAASSTSTGGLSAIADLRAAVAAARRRAARRAPRRAARRHRLQRRARTATAVDALPSPGTDTAPRAPGDAARARASSPRTSS